MNETEIDEEAEEERREPFRTARPGEESHSQLGNAKKPTDEPLVFGNGAGVRSDFLPIQQIKTAKTLYWT
jgi:hypothetical protein